VSTRSAFLPTTSSSSSSSGATSGTIKIGVDLPVSGADASIGIPTQNGAVLAVEEANKNGFAGGKFKLEASLLDDAVQGKHDPNAGAQNVKTFIADDAVLAMVGARHTVAWLRPSPAGRGPPGVTHPPWRPGGPRPAPAGSGRSGTRRPAAARRAAGSVGDSGGSSEAWVNSGHGCPGPRRP